MADKIQWFVNSRSRGVKKDVSIRKGCKNPAGGYVYNFTFRNESIPDMIYGVASFTDKLYMVIGIKGNRLYFIPNIEPGNGHSVQFSSNGNAYFAVKDQRLTRRLNKFIGDYKLGYDRDERRFCIERRVY